MLDTTKTDVLAEFGANTIKTGVSGIFCMIFDAYSVRYLRAPGENRLAENTETRK